MYDPIKMRGSMRAKFTIDGILACVWCGKPINGGFDPHHALVKSSSAKHPVVDNSICNRVPIHRICHSKHENDSELLTRSLDYLIERLGAERIARWYISLWRAHDLSVAQGVVPLCEHIATEQEWREYLELVVLPL